MYTFAESWARGLRLANALLALGLVPGDRVGVLEDNSLEAADLYVGAAAAGLVRVPLFARDTGTSHEQILRNTGCRALIASAAYGEMAGALRHAVPEVERLVVRDAEYEPWLAAHPADDPDVPTSLDDLLLIRHTGGTTGAPKGVAYTHRMWIRSFQDWFYRMPMMLPGDSFMHYAPISHGSGYCFLPAWIAGARNVLESRFDPATVLSQLVEERITHVAMVPTMLNLITRQWDGLERTFPDLRCLITGTAPISEPTVLASRRLFGDVLYQVYAQTEATPIAIMTPQEWFAAGPGGPQLRSAGRPAPFTELQIRDPDTREVLPADAEGELAVRCDGQMTGYLNDQEATNARLVDGFVLTGDIGRVDADGFVYVLDRRDDVIISGGFNIWPVELENAIESHPEVIEAAVFGVPDDTWGEAPHAVVRTAGASALDARQVIALCAARLGSYKKPREVVFTDTPLPRSPIGKLRRLELRAPHWAGRERRVAGS